MNRHNPLPCAGYDGFGAPRRGRNSSWFMVVPRDSRFFHVWLVVWLLLCVLFLLPCEPAGAAQAVSPTGIVVGCVELAGHSAYRGVAALWTSAPGQAPDPRRAIRPPLVSAPLDPSGCFTLQAAPGTYFVGAVVRLSEGGWQGPPRPGDWVFLSPDSAGKDLQVTLRPDEIVNLGRHASGWRYEGFVAEKDDLTITGRLADRAGQPLAGLLVFAFTDQAMSSEPLAISEPSDVQGRYLLRLPEPATVFLRAREHYGRRNPAEGGLMGVYGGEAPQAVTVNTDNRQAGGRDLTILLIPAQESRKLGKQGVPANAN